MLGELLDLRLNTCLEKQEVEFFTILIADDDSLFSSPLLLPEVLVHRQAPTDHVRHAGCATQLHQLVDSLFVLLAHPKIEANCLLWFGHVEPCDCKGHSATLDGAGPLGRFVRGLFIQVQGRSSFFGQGDEPTLRRVFQLTRNSSCYAHDVLL